jgi:hypothetical protein
MVNARMVNAGSSYFPPPHFCESFRVLGRILCFKNPVKYTRIFEINQPRAARRSHLLKKVTLHINAISRVLLPSTIT